MPEKPTNESIAIENLATQVEAGQITPEKAIEQVNAAIATINQQITQQETFTAAIQHFATAIKPVFEETIKIAKHVSEVMYKAYLEDGAIYGENHDGFQRWLNELSEMKNLRAKAERIEQHQAMIRDFKRIWNTKQGEPLE